MNYKQLRDYLNNCSDDILEQEVLIQGEDPEIEFVPAGLYTALSGSVADCLPEGHLYLMDRHCEEPDCDCENCTKYAVPDDDGGCCDPLDKSGYPVKFKHKEYYSVLTDLKLVPTT